MGRTRNFSSPALWPRSHIDYGEIYYRTIGMMMMNLIKQVWGSEMTWKILGWYTTITGMFLAGLFGWLAGIGLVTVIERGGLF